MSLTIRTRPLVDIQNTATETSGATITGARTVIDYPTLELTYAHTSTMMRQNGLEPFDSPDDPPEKQLTSLLQLIPETK